MCAKEQAWLLGWHLLYCVISTCPTPCQRAPASTLSLPQICAVQPDSCHHCISPSAAPERHFQQQQHQAGVRWGFHQTVLEQVLPAALVPWGSLQTGVPLIGRALSSSLSWAVHTLAGRTVRSACHLSPRRLNAKIGGEILAPESRSGREKAEGQEG